MLLGGPEIPWRVFTLASFIGFESTVVYRSEVRDPNRTIAIATYSSAIIPSRRHPRAGPGCRGPCDADPPRRDEEPLRRAPRLVERGGATRPGARRAQIAPLPALSRRPSPAEDRTYL
ncbi:MAG: APC family permease [Microbacteriaceae bacterium]|nr:MAG: APC family permease [Microbacteriaceae bacterium]